MGWGKGGKRASPIDPPLVSELFHLLRLRLSSVTRLERFQCEKILELVSLCLLAKTTLKFPRGMLKNF